jgi:hypothetical protein
MWSIDRGQAAFIAYAAVPIVHRVAERAFVDPNSRAISAIGRPVSMTHCTASA